MDQVEIEVVRLCGPKRDEEKARLKIQTKSNRARGRPRRGGKNKRFKLLRAPDTQKRRERHGAKAMCNPLLTPRHCTMFRGGTHLEVAQRDIECLSDIIRPPRNQ